jgi:hypothetical protein
VSLRVTDPEGVEWVVSREWFTIPEGARDVAWDLPDLPDVDTPFDDVAGLAVVVGVILAIVVFLLLLFVVLPLVAILIGVFLGVLLLLARISGLATWRVRAASVGRTLEWRVRGFLRSRRAMHGVARALELGGPDTLEGGPAPE